MTVRAKTLVKDKFWIVEQNGEKLGTLSKQDDNGWTFLSKKDQRQVFHTQESLFTRFGFNIFEQSDVKKPEEEVQSDNYDVLDFHVVNIHTILCLMYRNNCPCTPRHQNQRVSSAQDTTSSASRRGGAKPTVPK